MFSNAFELPTTWHVPGTPQEVAAILRDAERFPRWWGDVYLDVRVVDRGDARGVGARVDIHSKGWLPYHLHWTAVVTDADFPHTWGIAASGDLTGTGRWTLTPEPGGTCAQYDWRVVADRPLFRALAPLFAPVMASNHRWAMRKGEAGLIAELEGLRGG
jgi:uncharacterized protein YndB with AHSA1/START domain